jgi:sterol desaturase/sphingolipid hydroxylase (fatty acid hydroxylase superfamily)
MSAKNMTYLSSLLALPVLYVVFYAIYLSTQGHPISIATKWDRLLILAAIIIMERIYHYRYAVSQRHVLSRDVISNIVNLYVNGAVTALLLLPILLFFTGHFFGRKVVFAAPGQLGPIWLQVGVILFVVSLFRYWMHRIQHEVQFLWELHSYHHRVTDLKASNGLVSNPVDYSLRNIVIFVVMGIIGFNPIALLIAVPATQVIAVFSHCGADVKGGIFNYICVTPEVHRWHHSANIPEGHKYACNYGVEFIFWDIIFGTFYLPVENGQTVQPARIGHPGGLADEGSYLKVLLEPLGLYKPLAWLKRVPG